MRGKGVLGGRGYGLKGRRAVAVLPPGHGPPQVAEARRDETALASGAPAAEREASVEVVACVSAAAALLPVEGPATRQRACSTSRYALTGVSPGLSMNAITFLKGGARRSVGPRSRSTTSQSVHRPSSIASAASTVAGSCIRSKLGEAHTPGQELPCRRCPAGCSKSAFTAGSVMRSAHLERVLIMVRAARR